MNNYDLAYVAGDIMLRENGKELMTFSEEEFDNLFGRTQNMDEKDFVQTVVDWFYA